MTTLSKSNLVQKKVAKPPKMGVGSTKPPKWWIDAIPASQSHGSGILQKKLWRLVSDYVRIRDWYKFQGECVATGKYIQEWKEGQAGHFISYSTCNGIFKFDVDNIHMQSAQSNSWGGREDWKKYEDTLSARYGPGHVPLLELKNRDTGPKFSVKDTETLMKDLLTRMADLPEQPEYYQKVIMRL